MAGYTTRLNCPGSSEIHLWMTPLGESDLGTSRGATNMRKEEKENHTLGVLVHGAWRGPHAHGLTASPSPSSGYSGVIRHALLMHGLHWLREWTTRQDQQGGVGRDSTEMHRTRRSSRSLKMCIQSHQALTEPCMANRSKTWPDASGVKACA